MRKLFTLALTMLTLPLCGWHALPGALPLEKGKWSMATDVRISSISAREYVLVKDNAGDEYMLSRLDWELKALTTLGASFSRQAVAHSGLANFGIWFGLPTAGGTMGDYDWAHMDTTGTNLMYDDLWTNFSHHKNKLNHFISLDGNYFFQAGSKTLRFVGGGGVFLRSFRMDAYDGYLQYPADPTTTSPLDTPKTNVYGTGITYQLFTLAAYAGCGVIWNPGKIDVSLFGFVTPLTQLKAIDQHLMRHDYGADYLEFTDHIDMGWYIYSALRIGVALSPKMRLQLQAELLLQPKKRGDSYMELVGLNAGGWLDQQGASSTRGLSLALRLEFLL